MLQFSKAPLLKCFHVKGAKFISEGLQNLYYIFLLHLYLIVCELIYVIFFLHNHNLFVTILSFHCVDKVISEYLKNFLLISCMNLYVIVRDLTC